MRSNVNLKEQVQKMELGILEKRLSDKTPVVLPELEAEYFYFYDWFCSDSSLEAKMNQLVPKVKKIIDLFQIDVEKTYVFFKNNCPMYGELYDDFRICDLETGDVLFTITPRVGHYSVQNKAEIWSIVNNFQEPIFTAINWKTLVSGLKHVVDNTQTTALYSKAVEKVRQRYEAKVKTEESTQTKEVA